MEGNPFNSSEFVTLIPLLHILSVLHNAKKATTKPHYTIKKPIILLKNGVVEQALLRNNRPDDKIKVFFVNGSVETVPSGHPGSLYNLLPVSLSDLSKCFFNLYKFWLVEGNRSGIIERVRRLMV